MGMKQAALVKYEHHPTVQRALNRAREVGSKATTLKGLVRVIKRYGFSDQQTKTNWDRDWSRFVRNRKTCRLFEFLWRKTKEVLGGVQPELFVRFPSESLYAALVTAAWIKRAPVGWVHAAVVDAAKVILHHAQWRGSPIFITVVWGTDKPHVVGNQVPCKRKRRWKYAPGSYVHWYVPWSPTVEVGFQWVLEHFDELIPPRGTELTPLRTVPFEDYLLDLRGRLLVDKSGTNLWLQYRKQRLGPVDLRYLAMGRDDVEGYFLNTMAEFMLAYLVQHEGMGPELFWELTGYNLHDVSTVVYRALLRTGSLNEALEAMKEELTLKILEGAE